MPGVLSCAASSAIKRVAFLAAAVALAACTGSPTLRQAQGDTLPAARSAVPSERSESKGRATSPIAHVVFIVQENRSFNNFFMGYPGATTQKYGYDLQGRKIKLHQVNLKDGYDIDHFSSSFFESCDGKGKLPGTKCRMDGWDRELTGFGAPKHAPYAYVPESQIDPYWKMAQQYVLADRMFASNLDGSFIAHQYVVAAYASRGVDSPYGAWGCSGGSYDVLPTLTAKRKYGPTISACLNNATIASEADAAGVTWRFYTGPINGDGGLWNSYQADYQIYYGPDWKSDVITPPSQFLTDIAAGKLANVTWITPTYENSDHPGDDTGNGPAWVSSVVNAIGKSSFWKSSAIFIMWDDWGGWFDPVKPPLEDYDGLGFRVPLIMISPYAKQGSVTHVQYETSSVLRFIEDNFGLAPLAKSDARANDPANDAAAFDYSQQPRTFKRFRGAKPDSYWIEQDRASRLRGKPPAFIGND